MEYVIKSIESVNEVINNALADTAATAKERSNSRECGYKYCENTIKVYGADVFAEIQKRFPEVSEPYWRWQFNGKKAFADRNKSAAQIVQVFTIEVYCDARTMLNASFTSTIIDLMIRTENGTELDFYATSNKCKTFRLQLAYDRRDYNDYSFEHLFTDTAPNAVGTLTDKKLAEWLNYLNGRKTAYDAWENEKYNKGAAFLEKVKKAAEGADKSNVTPTYGWVEKGHLRLTYEIVKDTPKAKIQFIKTPLTDEAIEKFLEWTA